MALDIRTLVLVLGVTHAIQVVVFIHQKLVNRTIRGVGWWLLWTATEVVAFSFMLLRGIPSIQSAAIIAQNGFLILGVMFFYIGIMRFLGQNENRRFLALLYAVFLAALCYFLFVHDDINTRGAIISATLVTMAFLSSRALLANRRRAIAVSANFLAAVCIAHGCHFGIRLVVQLAAPPPDVFFAPTLFNWTGLMDAIVIGLLWTFGSILMINQRLNADMRDAKDEIERMFNTSPDAVLVSRLSDGTIVNVNEGFLALSGFQRDECVGKTTLAVNVWKRPKDRESVVNELRRTGGCRNYEAVFQRKDGSELPGLLSAVVFNLQDVPHVISVMRDITDRKRVETEKAELEALKHQLQKVESLGRMAGAIAHHFNNRLQAVLGNLELAVEEQRRGVSSADSLNEAIASAREAATVSGLMLTYLGKAPVRLEPVDLAEACRQSLPLLRAAMPKSVTLETDVPSPGPVIDANANQMQQLLSNLATNAWEAMGDGQGTIHVTVSIVSPADITGTRRYPLEWRPQQRAYACLEVADAGCGISDDMFGTLFDPFFSTKFTGRGLGLPVVLGILRTHDGVITVKSEPGRGSTFRVFFPVSAQPAPQARPLAPVQKLASATPLPQAPVASGGGTVLVVEDDKGVRRVAARMLTQLGYAVVEARDGVEALDVFAKHRDGIRLVLCDLTMPRLDGWQTLAALRQLAPDIPVILASGYDEASVMAGDHPERPQAFVNKPYQFEDLQAAIRKAVRCISHQ